MAKSFLTIVKQRLIKELGLRGFEKKSSMSPIDFRSLPVSPLEAVNRANCSPVLVDIPLQRCRAMGMLAFPCHKSSSHPFIQTICEYREHRISNYSESALNNYYHNFKPANVAEYLGINDKSWHKSFERSPLQAIEPWGGVISKAEQERKVRVMREEGTPNRKKLESNEWSFIGPISKERGVMEFERLTAIAESIDTRGYIRSGHKDGDIIGKLLLRGEEFSVLIGAGQHRVAALAAIGYLQAPICVKPGNDSIIRREDAESWPGVVAGQFTIEQAQTIFDRVFEGLQPQHYNTVNQVNLY